MHVVQRINENVSVSKPVKNTELEFFFCNTETAVENLYAPFNLTVEFLF